MFLCTNVRFSYMPKAVMWHLGYRSVSGAKQGLFYFCMMVCCPCCTLGPGWSTPGSRNPRSGKSCWLQDHRSSPETSRCTLRTVPAWVQAGSDHSMRKLLNFLKTLESRLRGTGGEDIQNRYLSQTGTHVLCFGSGNSLSPWF